MDLPQIGERIAVTGPNGSGKTTLLRQMAREAVRQGIRCFFLPQTPAFPPVKVLDYVLLGRTRHLPAWRKTPSRDLSIALSALDTLHIAHFASRPLRQLSQGERQRCALALALASEADIFFLDEPSAFLDSSSRAVFYSAFARATLAMAIHGALPPSFFTRRILLP
ncbi:MAG: ABC transporter ATP-binding protein [Kiritimatiellae bacterium]|nr:ABC transporter ATP-binding protein [Kiritimatiellia bacterium]